MKKLPNKLVKDYVLKFFGYGSWKANIWFVGMEEGGSDNVRDVEGRLKVWKKQGGHFLSDCKSIHFKRGEVRWHDASAKGIQRTWKNLIRMYLLAHGKKDTREYILDFQHNEFGKRRGSTCSMELFPLPSPNVATWNYGKWSDWHWLKSRREYEAEVIKKRIALIKQKIRIHKPTIVIFYGSSLLVHWNDIAHNELKELGHRELKDNKIVGGKLWVGKKDGVSFYVTHHPTGRAIPTAYFEGIGKMLRQKHSKYLR